MAKRGKYTQAEIVAYTILGEAAGEGPAGMAAVAQVIKNRALSGKYPSNFASVALQRSRKGTYQFTTWSPKDGNSPIKKYSRNSPAYKQALKIANTILYGDVPDPTGGALNYYANQGPNAIPAPGWFSGAATGGEVQLGNHLFAARGAAGIDNAAYQAALDVALNGAPTPLPLPQSVVNRRNGLTSGGLTLPAPLVPEMAGAVPQGQTSSRGAAGAAMRRTVGRDRQALGGLITRRVQTVPVTPGTGQDPSYTGAGYNGRTIDSAIDYMSMTSGSRANPQPAQTGGKSPTERDEAKTGIKRNVTTIVQRQDGTTYTMPRAGDRVMPAGARPPSLPRVIPPSEAANANLAQARSEQKTITRMVAKTILVQNPEWGKVNPAAVQKLQDIHDREDARIMAAQTPAAIAAEVPQFIEQTIMVPVTDTVTIPAAPGRRAPGVASPLASIRGSATGAAYQVGQQYTAGGYVYSAQADGTFKQEGPDPSMAGMSSAERYNALNKAARDRALAGRGSNSQDRAEARDSAFYDSMWGGITESLV